MDKRAADFRVVSKRMCGGSFAILSLTPADDVMVLPNMHPGQFVQVLTGNRGAFLRRPISINLVDIEKRLVYLLVRDAGDGTGWLVDREPGDIVNMVIPLGNGFTIPDDPAFRPLLVGGGVGIAPLLYLGTEMHRRGILPEFLIGARSADMLLELEELRAVGTVHVATDDGSAGEHGLVTQHSAISADYDRIYCCGPSPMMKGVAAIARKRGIDCEVSLENMMACGVGACLCCVEKTVRGNICVCTFGPVFNVNDLTW